MGVLWLYEIYNKECIYFIIIYKLCYTFIIKIYRVFFSLGEKVIKHLTAYHWSNLCVFFFRSLFYFIVNIFS